MSDRAEVIAAVLAEHERCRPTIVVGSKIGYHWTCGREWHEPFNLRAHVAAELDRALPSEERIEAMMRLLVDDGHMTPMAVRQLRSVLRPEES